VRVAELTTYTSRLNGGVFYALSALLPEIARSVPSDELKVFGYADPHTEDDRSAWSPVKVEAIRPWHPKHFGYSPRFYPALAAFKPDIMHVHGLWTYLSMAALKVHRRSGVPAVISPHGMLDPWALGFSRTRKRIAAAAFQDALLREGSVIHALNESEARSIRSYGLSNPVVVIPNGVSLHCGSATAPPWEAKDGEKVLLFLSRIHPKKGLDLLVGAWADLAGRGGKAVGWRLIIAGWDEIGHEPELKALVAAKGIEGSVAFVGPLFGAAKSAALAHADAFALTSRSEGLPMAVLEAWANSKPVLMTTACNLPEGLKQGAAIEVNSSLEAVREGLRRLFGLTDSERSQMGKAGRRLVESRFTWDRVASDMSRVYSAAASGRGMPADLLHTGMEAKGL
jgi:glycosyltransferase involved in cell wall biosynthesis